MTRLILYLPTSLSSPQPGTSGSSIPCSTLIWDDVLPAPSLVASINDGVYRFPFTPQPGPVIAFQYGDLVFVTRRPADDQEKIHLSQRQKQVLTLLAEGYSLQQISFQLGIKLRTVVFHLERLKQRLGADTGEQLVARAIALGLYRPSLPD